MSCIKTAPTNKGKSLLFESIYNDIAEMNESKATALYSYFNSESFINSFGDWKKSYTKGIVLGDRVDHNGEPLLFKNEDGSNYYKDKDGNKVSFPVVQGSLLNTFDVPTIKTLAQYFGVTYLSETRNVSMAEVDLDTELSDQSLTEFIEEAYAKRIIQLEDSEDFEDAMSLEMLEDTREISHEWIPHIREFYRSLSLNFEENEEALNADNIVEETSREDAIGVASFERSSKKNVRTEVKIKLSMIHDNNGYEPIFGGQAYLPLDNVREAIGSTLSDIYILKDSEGVIIDPAIEMVKRLDALTLKRPEFKYITDEIAKVKDPAAKDLLITQFYQAFNLQRNTVMADSLTTTTRQVVNMSLPHRPTVVIDGVAQTTKEVTSTSKNITDSASSSKSIRSMWNASFFDMVTGNEPVPSATNTAARIEEKVEELRKFNARITEEGSKGLDVFNENIQTRTIELQEILMGIVGDVLDPRAVSDALNHGTEKYLTDLSRFKVFTENLAKDLEGARNVVKDVKKGKMETDIISGSKSLATLAKSQSFYSDNTSSATVFAGGKNIWLLSNKGYLKTLIETWKRDPKQLEDLYRSSPEQESSVWLKYLLAEDIEDAAEKEFEKAERISNMNVALLTDLFLNIENKASEESAVSDVSKFDFIVNDFNKVIRSITSSFKKIAKGNYSRTITPADKKTTLMVSMGKPLNTFQGVDENGKVLLSKETITAFTNYVQSDIRNAIKAKNELDAAMRMTKIDSISKLEVEKTPEEKLHDLMKLKVHYHFKKNNLVVTKDADGVIQSVALKNPSNRGNVFSNQKFPELSNGFDFTTSKHAEILKQIHSRLYVGADVHAAIIAGDGFIADSRLETVNELQGKDNELSTLLGEYISEILSENVQDAHNYMIDEGIIEYSGADMTTSLLDDTLQAQMINIYSRTSREDGKGKIIDADSQKALLGTAIAAEYYVNSVINSIEYSKLFTGNPAYYKDMIDFKKRVPATYTDGLTLRLKKGQENFKFAVIDAVEVASPYLESLRATFGDAVASKYEEINSSDAQAWITPARWKFLQEGLGKWSATHESFYKKMISGEVEHYTNDELKVASQPLKGVYFNLNPDGSPLYFKYSQAVLTPAMVKNNELQGVYDKMIEQGIDELITLDGVKVGSPATSKIHSENGDVLTDINFNVMEASNIGWKLQQDLPTKTYKDTEIGSQIQKNIFAGLIHNPDLEFEVDGVIMKGSKVVDEIVKEFTNLSDAGLKSLFNEFGIGTNSKNGAKYRIQNVDRYYGALIEELKSRGGNRNIIEALEKQVSIAGIPQARQKINNMFASIVNKRIIKLKTNGGSFIQMSNFGLNYNDVTAKDSGIMLHPDFMKLTQGKGKTMEPLSKVDEKTGRTSIAPGGIFISGSFIAKYVPDYKKYTPEQLFGYTNESGEFVQGVIDTKILESLIGYRIPNQGLASNDALQILGILPEENGDTIIAYTGITTKTGSDFDIDKMYLMMPSYHFNEETGRLEYADKEGTKEASQNRIIQLYKAVLTNTTVAKDVMLPIDFEFLKTDVSDLTKDFSGDTSKALFHFNPFNDISLMYDFRSGKAGVGQEANWMVDISRSGKLMFKGVHHFLWFNSTGNQDLINKANLGIIELDPEYSHKLSDEDLTYYKGVLESIGLKPSAIESILNEIENVKIASSLTAILNAFVDIAKDPFITRGNWVTTTTNIGNTLLRTGIHPLYINAFMAQPILRDYIESGKRKISSKANLSPRNAYLRQVLIRNLSEGDKRFGNVKYSTIYNNIVKDVNIVQKGTRISDTSLDNLNERKVLSAAGINIKDKSYTVEDVERLTAVAKEVINELTVLHFDTFARSEINPTNTEVYDLKYYREQVTSNNPDIHFQKAILDKFLEYSEMNKQLGDNIRLSKTDTSGTGDNISNMLTLFNLRKFMNERSHDEDAKGVTLVGMESKFDGTVLGAYFKNLVHVLNVSTKNPELFPDMKPSNLKTVNNISYALTGAPVTSEELLKLINDHAYTSMMGQFFNISQSERVDLLKKLPSEIMQLRKDGIDNEFIKALGVKNLGPDSNVGRILTLPNNVRSAVQEDILTDSWLKLMTSHPEIAEKLVKYSFVTTGFQYTSTQFFTLIPNEYFINRDINKYVREYEEGSLFESEFIANNKDNPTIMKLVDKMKPFQVLRKEVGQEYIVYGLNPLIDEKPSRFMMNSGLLYEAVGIDQSQVSYRKVENRGYTVGSLKVPEYNVKYEDRLLAMSTQAAERAMTTNEALNVLLTDVQPLSFQADASHFDILDNIEEVFKDTHVNVTTSHFENIKLLNTFSSEGINTMRGISSKNSFGNPFTGSRVKNQIDVNINALTLEDVRNIVNGKSMTSPMKLVENKEAATDAYHRWLLGDDSMIPEDRLEELTARREFIRTQLKNPNSETNKLLDTGAKFLYMIDRVRGIKYKSHADVLAELSEQFRSHPSYTESKLLAMRENAEVLDNFNEVTTSENSVEENSQIVPTLNTQETLLESFTNLVNDKLLNLRISSQEIEAIRQDIIKGVFKNIEDLTNYIENCM